MEFTERILNRGEADSLHIFQGRKPKGEPTQTVRSRPFSRMELYKQPFSRKNNSTNDIFYGEE